MPTPALQMRENSPKLARGVLVTRHFPSDPQSSSAGVFQRLQLLLCAMQRACESLEVVFLLEPDAESDAVQHAKLCTQAKEWIGEGTSRVSVRVVGRQRVAPPTSLWKRYVPGIISVFGQASFAWYAEGRPLEVLDEILSSNPDVLLCHRLETAVPLLRLENRPTRLIVDLDDVEHVSLWRRMLRSPDWPSERLRLLHVPALAIGEFRVARLARHMLVCSGTDARYLNRLWGMQRALPIPNAVSLPVLAPVAAEGSGNNSEIPVCLFLGTYNYGPNVDAAIHLVNDIWPLVRKRWPNAELWLAGPGSERLPAALADGSGVSVTGFVADLTALYARAALVCCPIRAGSGTRIKILEAAAHGKAVISTEIGAEGIELVPGKEIEIADSSEGFAERCIELLNDPKRRLALGNRARDAITQHYERSVILDRLVSVILD